MRFVTDFLWRSPLGLRINAVDTAGVTQTEDWVKIRGDQLVARDGAYDVRITAELWETHFIDHISLLVVDHPADTEVFVDERFAKEAPALAVHTLTRPRPVTQAWDESGRDVTDLVAKQDGRYLATFARGDYQGIAKDHFVEMDLGGPERAAPQESSLGRPFRGRHAPHNSVGRPFQGRRWLVANGWIYPTDSSINVAIGQQNLQPHGLSLEAQDERGNWRVVTPDLGFPAGKNKTILIDLRPAGNARRVRLRRGRDQLGAVAGGGLGPVLDELGKFPDRARPARRHVVATGREGRRRRVFNLPQEGREGGRDVHVSPPFFLFPGRGRSLVTAGSAAALRGTDRRPRRTSPRGRS